MPGRRGSLAAFDACLLPVKAPLCRHPNVLKFLLGAAVIAAATAFSEMSLKWHYSILQSFPNCKIKVHVGEKAWVKKKKFKAKFTQVLPLTQPLLHVSDGFHRQSSNAPQKPREIPFFFFTILKMRNVSLLTLCNCAHCKCHRYVLMGIFALAWQRATLACVPLHKTGSLTLVIGIYRRSGSIGLWSGREGTVLGNQRWSCQNC